MENLTRRFIEFTKFFVKCIRETSLSHVCLGNPSLAKYYPDEDFYRGKETFNLLENLTWYDSEQIVKDLKLALEMNQFYFVAEALDFVH